LDELFSEILKWLTALAVLATAFLNFLTTQENRKLLKTAEKQLKRDE